MTESGTTRCAPVTGPPGTIEARSSSSRAPAEVGAPSSSTTAPAPGARVTGPASGPTTTTSARAASGTISKPLVASSAASAAAPGSAGPCGRPTRWTVPNSAIAASWRWTARNVTAQYVPAWLPRNGSCVGPFDDPRTTKRRARIAPARRSCRHVRTARRPADGVLSTEPAEIFTPKPEGSRSTRRCAGYPCARHAHTLDAEQTRELTAALGEGGLRCPAGRSGRRRPGSWSASLRRSLPRRRCGSVPWITRIVRLSTTPEL